ncbi:outer membrane protein assembly factor BamA [Candidatus Pelagibacter sp.]|nr:outer membrane protein assembly factor BamA [Candidatus Pelagibacter sp.]
MIRFKNIVVIISTYLFLLSHSYSEIIKSVVIEGNERISNETIMMFSKIEMDKDYDDNDINNILKSLYDTNFFQDVSIKLNSQKLLIIVKENPVIENIKYNGIKSDTIRETILRDLQLKSRSSFNEILLNKDKNLILSSLKNIGYYFSTVNIDVENVGSNKVDLTFNINLGDKAKIKKISFVGNKVFKDNRLRSLIISEEYKFWKIISGKKYLNENVIVFDKRLLKNFYLNQGYYNVEVNSSYARLVNDNEFELVFNIDAKNKIFFGNLNINLPSDFDPSNFSKINKLFSEIKGKPYSINMVEKILNEVDLISINDQFESVNASVKEILEQDKINLTFTIEESNRYTVEKINILGNNITKESVIRNQFVIDEGDFYNEILKTRSINNIKSLNFFKKVNSEVIDGFSDSSKIINIIVEEKPTGEIFAGAGFGTAGETLTFGIKENNYLGEGLNVATNFSLSPDDFSGKFSITNPNYQNSNNSVYVDLQIAENDRLTNFGYKSNKIGGSTGINFEYLDDFRLGMGISSYLEKIKTDSTASARQKSQEGDFFDTYALLNFDYDKRNQRYKTTDGYRSSYNVNLPIISESNTLVNGYSFRKYSELYENNISTFSLSVGAAESLTGDEIKLSERMFVPQNKLRGFVNGKVGPKDGSDYIGGNYYTAINFTSSLPQILPNAQSIDVVSFFDIANVWGVDNSSVQENSKLRSSIGIGIDWFTPIGPLNFSLAHAITKNSTDETESFRFNLGTSF